MAGDKPNPSAKDRAFVESFVALTKTLFDGKLDDELKKAKIDRSVFEEMKKIPEVAAYTNAMDAYFDGARKGITVPNPTQGGAPLLKFQRPQNSQEVFGHIEKFGLSKGMEKNQAKELAKLYSIEYGAKLAIEGGKHALLEGPESAELIADLRKSTSETTERLKSTAIDMAKQVAGPLFALPAMGSTIKGIIKGLSDVGPNGMPPSPPAATPAGNGQQKGASEVR